MHMQYHSDISWFQLTTIMPTVMIIHTRIMELLWISDLSTLPYWNDEDNLQIYYYTSADQLLFTVSKGRLPPRVGWGSEGPCHLWCLHNICHLHTWHDKKIRPQLFEDWKRTCYGSILIWWVNTPICMLKCLSLSYTLNFACIIIFNSSDSKPKETFMRHARWKDHNT